MLYNLSEIQDIYLELCRQLIRIMIVQYNCSIHSCAKLQTDRQSDRQTDRQTCW